MTLRNFAERARQIVNDTLFTDEAEIDRILVGDAVIAREGEHYRIVTGDDSWHDLETQARRLEGLCDCGALLSTKGDRSRCRTCGREFRATA
jgi:tRNA(Ile2) C34 agmatinyltransferase TiaS